MVEFKGTPFDPQRKFDKTGFFILWPVAAFPLVFGPIALVTNAREIVADPGGVLFMCLAALVWVLFWGSIPIFVYRADVNAARAIAASSAIVDDMGVEFKTPRKVHRFKWSDMKSIRLVPESDYGDISFKANNGSYCYERWLEADDRFLDEVRKHFPDMSVN